MTTLAQNDFSSAHAGVVRAERAIEALLEIGRGIRSASFLGAALLAALVVVANEVVSTWTDGHLLAAWVIMCALLFGAIALLIAPVRRGSGAAGSALARWKAGRRQAAEDRRVWDMAMRDARVMADIQRAMVAQPELRDAR
jgi:apolipoprotein N-acyltransferase